MLRNLRLWAKAMLAMGLSIMVVGGMLTFANLRTMESLILKAEREELDAHLKALTNSIAAESRMAEAMAALVGNIPLVQEKFDADDRKALSALFNSGFKVMSKDYGVEQFQFHTPPATSYLRVHKPEKFGDDLSSFRKTVVATNDTKKPVRGLEGGVAGLGARGIVPVFHGGKHVGSVEFGMTFGQAFFDNFKTLNKVDVSLDIANNDTFKTMASTMGKEPILATEVLRRAMNGEPQLEHRTIQGASYAVYAAPVGDFSGKAIGVVEIAMDNGAYLTSLSGARNSAFLMGFVSLALGFAVAFFSARHLVGRIGVVVAGVNRVAMGDLSADIVDDHADEIGQLALAANEMRRQLHELAAQVAMHADRVNEASMEIAGAVESQAATSTEMSSSVAEITSTMEELSASSTQIADHSKSVVDIATQTWESSKRGSEAMQLVQSRMEGIRADNQNSLEEIVALGTKSREISKVMEIINAIADQTKLIAFNAALEASSAGEAGKRFSVVAQEIRRLADSVTDSTGEIESKVQEIQDSISRLVITSEQGAGAIGAGMEATVTTGQRLGELVGAASHTTSAAQQISLSTQQQKTASNQVVMALREIVTASSHTAQSIGRISQVSREMTGMSAELRELVGQFKLEKGGAG